MKIGYLSDFFQFYYYGKIERWAPPGFKYWIQLSNRIYDDSRAGGSGVGARLIFCYR
ncbi:MAG: hypothetical protein ACTSXP_07055 [Promethearchaeota archaeon]